MKIYLVGGAVRDQLLNLPVQERDWVVIGSTPEQLLAQGFKPVGKDFPVFLHPITHEEYALARTERKVAKGYQGFEFYTAPNITLEEDLGRRDLTINAIAQAEDGTLIDPYHGIDDLHTGILRHVSPAFVEDPLRVLRVARFAARFGNFTVAKETIELMKIIAQSGELAALTSERIFKELQRALSENYPQRFFTILQKCNAFNCLFPEINLSNLNFLEHSVQITKEPTIRFAVLFANLAKENDLHLFAKRLAIPRQYYELALLTCQYHAELLSIPLQTPEFILTLLKKSDAFRRTSRFFQLLTACQVIYLDITDFTKTAAILTEVLQRCNKLRLDPTTTKLSGPAIGQAIDAQRLKIIQQILD